MEQEEPKYCIFCGKIQTVKDVRVSYNYREPQCHLCGNLLGIILVRCLGTGCKGKNLFLSPGYPAPNFERTIECPLCGEVGQFAEVEA